jgi:hypothetical protein
MGLTSPERALLEMVTLPEPGGARSPGPGVGCDDRVRAQSPR